MPTSLFVVTVGRHHQCLCSLMFLSSNIATNAIVRGRSPRRGRLDNSADELFERTRFNHYTITDSYRSVSLDTIRCQGAHDKQWVERLFSENPIPSGHRDWFTQ